MSHLETPMTTRHSELKVTAEGTFPDIRLASSTELLILKDGRILVHNLTRAFAELLSELNPSDERLSAEGRAHRITAGGGDLACGFQPRPVPGNGKEGAARPMRREGHMTREQMKL